MEMKDDGDPFAAGASHQLQIGGMAAVGEDDLGPEAVEDLIEEVEEDGPFLAHRRTFGTARRGGRERDADPLDGEVEARDDRAVGKFDVGARGRFSQGGQGVFQGGLGFEVEHAGEQDAAIDAALGQEFEEVARGQGGTAGGVEVAVDRGEEQAFQSRAHDVTAPVGAGLGSPGRVRTVQPEALPRYSKACQPPAATNARTAAPTPKSG